MFTLHFLELKKEWMVAEEEYKFYKQIVLIFAGVFPSRKEKNIKQTIFLIHQVK